MPRYSTRDQEFRKAVCAAIDRYISEHKMTDVQAANDLGVRKQNIGLYRRGERLPGTEVIARACVEWKLSFPFRGTEISAKTLAGNGRQSQPLVLPYQLQLPLEEALEFRGASERVRDVQFTITLKRVS